MDGEHVAEGEPGFDDYVDAAHLHGAELWREHRDELLAEWIAQLPGTRPHGWFEYELPFGAARLKLGGTGEESTIWFQSEAMFAYFDADAEDPPRIESVATFLRRRKLLQPGEAKRIAKTAFSPVRLEADRDGWAPPLA